MIRAISFDYGNVLGLLDLDELSRRTGLPAERLAAKVPAAYAAHDAVIAGGGGHEAGWRALMRTFVPDDAVVERLWRLQPAANLWRHVPDGARALLADLDAAGVPMVVTSNSEGRAAELLAELGIARHFRAVLDSGRLGIAKPDRRIFEAAAQAAGVPIGELAHVGDSEAADVVGARDAGAVAVRFDGAVPERRSLSTVAHHRAATYDELRAVLTYARSSSRRARS